MIAAQSPTTSEVEAWPAERRSQYAVFSTKCSKCHSLDRPLQADFTADRWVRYVRKMTRRPGSGINEASGEQIVAFLSWFRTRDATAPAPARASATPPSDEVLLPPLLRALGYEHEIGARVSAASEAVVLVVGDAAARARVTSWRAATPQALLVQGARVAMRAVETTQLDAEVQGATIVAVLFAGGVEPGLVRSLAAAAHSRGRVTLSLDPRDAVSVVLSSELVGEHSKLTLNLTAATAAKADFGTALLRVSNVIRP